MNGLNRLHGTDEAKPSRCKDKTMIILVLGFNKGGIVMLLDIRPGF